MRGWVIGALLLLATSAAALAETAPGNASAALTAIGLVGTFSPNCAATGQTRSHVTYTVPAAGDPTSLSETVAAEITARVVTATLVGDNSIHLTTEIIAKKLMPNAVGGSEAIGTRYDTTLEKTSDGFRLMQSRQIGGSVLVKDGVSTSLLHAPMPVLHRCQ